VSNPANKKPYKRIALVLSLCSLIIWGILGTGASLAWFVDTSDVVTNIFHTANFDLEVSHRTDDYKWESIDAKTDIFDDEALYEPGYVQVIYLKVENKGDRAFDFYTAISVRGSTTATNVFGQQFWLHEHLKFGVAIANSVEEMEEAVSTREKANTIATMKLQNYSTEVAALNPGDTAYLALVVRMPEEVGNEANYREGVIPKVELGIIVKAEQQK
jgi:hypothetical protein